MSIPVKPKKVVLTSDTEQIRTEGSLKFLVENYGTATVLLSEHAQDDYGWAVPGTEDAKLPNARDFDLGHGYVWGCHFDFKFQAEQGQTNHVVVTILTPPKTSNKTEVKPEL